MLFSCRSFCSFYASGNPPATARHVVPRGEHGSQNLQTVPKPTWPLAYGRESRGA
jgi:hypothetical protein